MDATAGAIASVLPGEEPGLLWDRAMLADNSKALEVRDLMQKAFKSPLPAQAQQQLLGLLDSDPKMIFQSGLAPRNLADLVEQNPLVAIESLLKLMSSSQITEYVTSFFRC
jgi:hypothetical protein